jgi:glutathione synthase
MRAITLTGGDPWFAEGETEWRDLADFDAVIMRTDPPFDQAICTPPGCWKWPSGRARGCSTGRNRCAITTRNWRLPAFPQFIAPTLVSNDAPMIRNSRRAGRHRGEAVECDGRQRHLPLRPGDANLGAILETVTRNGAETIMAQRYLPEIKDGDKRILVIDGEAVPYCLARIPAEGETRGNLAAGGTGVARPLTNATWEIAARSARH